MPGTMAEAMCFQPSRPWKAESGCRLMQRMAGLNSFRRRAVPTNVPLVPSPATKWVIRPPVCSQISGAVVW